ncbi:hypothetical protein [Phyllobacterium endophyticum]|uniref:hypothetical protein n=1 Tax=Phyllobacterium endophyticum TaxID=1149773 RepID=UPI0014762979|nr:hypothetical protein [Phyllobacterium endophyticum]MBB3235568.1 hypothetical protein [Phyllobacterium endophyticum]
MIISSRMERRLSIAATALLTAATLIIPVATRAYHDTRSNPDGYTWLADATPGKALIEK